MNSEINESIITIDKGAGIWYLLLSKKQTNAKFYYHGHLIPQDINPVFRDTLIDYTALLNIEKNDDDDNEDYMLTPNVAYALGWDLIHLSEIEKYNKVIQKNGLALYLLVSAKVTSEGDGSFEERIRMRRLELKEIINKVEEEIGIEN